MKTVPDPIRKITLTGGRVRYRFVVDIGRDHVTGKRMQKTFTYDMRRVAVAELAKIRAAMSDGTYVRPSKLTLNEHLDEWLPPVLRDRAAATARNYADALKPVRERLGDKRLQAITKADIEGLVTFMLTSGRKRGGAAGTGLSGRSVALTLGRLTAALEMAVAEGKLVRNPAKLVKPPRHVQREKPTWSTTQVQQFLDAGRGDRLAAAWRMSMYGLRRGEVLGLKWSAVSWGSFAESCGRHSERWCATCYGSNGGDRPTTIRIDLTRTLVDYTVVVKTPKSSNGLRTLPVDVDVASALRALWVRQAAEKLAAGAAYTDSGWVVVDELGAPVHPEWYSDGFERLAKEAGLPRIVLHGARHTALSLMEKAGVPISIVSKWAGHYDVRFTYSTYVHAEAADLGAGSAALGRLYGTTN